MKKEIRKPYVMNSISELHRVMGLPKPVHPLVSLVDQNDIKNGNNEIAKGFLLNFYMVCIKTNFKGKFKYGQHHYDFDEGVMTFIAPNQLISEPEVESDDYAGWMLLIHPDFIRNHPLGKHIKAYGFFSYDVSEALHLSEAEETMVMSVMQNMEKEYRSVIDPYSQDVIISYIELLLNYSNRFYNRQFITRKSVNHDLLTRLDELLNNYFSSNMPERLTVQYVSEQLHVSPNYLSDMLRSLTGQNTQQHIHAKLIEKAKEILSTTSLSVSEIAYQLGFEYSQSFNKLFKNKTSVSPLEFRQAFRQN